MRTRGVPTAPIKYAVGVEKYKALLSEPVIDADWADDVGRNSEVFAAVSSTAFFSACNYLGVQIYSKVLFFGASFSSQLHVCQRQRQGALEDDILQEGEHTHVEIRSC